MKPIFTLADIQEYKKSIKRQYNVLAICDAFDEQEKVQIRAIYKELYKLVSKMIIKRINNITVVLDK